MLRSPTLIVTICLTLVVGCHPLSSRHKHQPTLSPSDVAKIKSELKVNQDGWEYEEAGLLGGKDIILLLRGTISDDAAKAVPSMAGVKTARQLALGRLKQHPWFATKDETETWQIPPTNSKLRITITIGKTPRSDDSRRELFVMVSGHHSTAVFGIFD